MTVTARTGRVQDAVERAKHAVGTAPFCPLFGEVIHINGPVVHAALETARIGQMCRIAGANGTASILGRVIGVKNTHAIISPFTGCDGLAVGALVTPQNGDFTVPFGPELIGRVLDGFGAPLDDLGELGADMRRVPVRHAAPLPMSRPLISNRLVTGIRAIDSAMTLGRGQRVGIFGPPGTGKSSLLSGIAQHCDADVIVVGMIGERGREVREFLDRQLPLEKRDKVVVVVATSDRSPMERVNGAHVATAIAEGFRDDGKSVLLLIDSLTRVARALREIGLAAGEPPTRRGYPASVYPALPELIERAGCTDTGEITALYTVLVEGDGEADPIAEETRSLTDGHITLSKEIADGGRYPAIDVLKSLSRVMNDIVVTDHLQMSKVMRGLLAKYAEIEVLLQVGEYQSGADPIADRAILQVPRIRAFLAQETDKSAGLDETLADLRKVLT